MSVKSFDWVPFYKELADQLLPYQNNRQELIEKVRQIYAMTGIGMPTLEQDDPSFFSPPGADPGREVSLIPGILLCRVSVTFQ